MNKTLAAQTLAALTVLCGLAAAAPAIAHHSFAMFDMSKTQTIQGTVSEWQWTNPHTFISLAVTGTDGKTVTWPIEGQSPNILVRQGWNAKALKVGDKISITIHPIKAGTVGGSIISVTAADGKVLGRPPGA